MTKVYTGKGYKPAPAIWTAYPDNPSKFAKRIFGASRPGYSLGKNKVAYPEVIDKHVQQFKEKDINVVFVLLTDGESWKYYDKDLVTEYQRRGMRVFRYPIVDHGTPTCQLGSRLVRDVHRCLAAKYDTPEWTCKNIVIHCSAGIGRTGLALSCLAAYMGPSWLGKESQTDAQSEYVVELWDWMKEKNLLSSASVKAAKTGWKPKVLKLRKHDTKWLYPESAYGSYGRMDTVKKGFTSGEGTPRTDHVSLSRFDYTNGEIRSKRNV